MKKILFILLALISYSAHAQLPEVHLPISGDLHFLSPEPIQYVDISNKNIEGNLGLPNLLRLRFKKDSIWPDAIITIAGEKFIAQYHLLPVESTENEMIAIQPGDTRPLDISSIGFSHPELRKMAYSLFCNTSSSKETVKAFGIKASLNHVYTAGDYLFLDVSYKNKTNLSYNIDDFRFTLDDKKVTKATNIQSVVIKPELALFEIPQFDKFYRNIFVLKKLSYPGSKVLTIGLSEKQISGRIINLAIPYKDVLQADIINF
jgi:conjugative transposon TraN protein